MLKHRLLALLVGISATAVGTSAQAYGGHWGHHGYRHHHNSHFGFYFGSPFFWGPRLYDRPYFDDYYYAPRTVIIEREPPVYIQRPVAPIQTAQLWYYCPNPAGYYPYVPTCTQPWVPVDPRSLPPAPTSPPPR